MALGFVSRSPELFVPFVAIVLPALFILGLFTAVRLVDSNLEGILYPERHRPDPPILSDAGPGRGRGLLARVRPLAGESFLAGASHGALRRLHHHDREHGRLP